MTTEAHGTAPQGNHLVKALRPLLVDVAVPLGIYYLAHEGLGLDLMTSLVLGSVIPAVRTVAAAALRRSVNGLAGLMLAVNLAGIALSFVTGDPRLMIAKDSGVSSVIGLTVLLSALGPRPLMTAGLEPFITRGDAARTAAWARLRAGSARFRTLERRFSVLWGGTLLAECAVRTVGAYTVPVETMAWLGAVILVAALAAAALAGNGVAAEPMKRLVDEEVRAGETRTEEPCAPATAAAPPVLAA
ncbi:VC0807 family protein [Actinomadura fibrosa]|uniref:VC0807 family protein n=1 Tax=Actinomadura fibrosa TaxID=111802 RepID=A0ABW2Y0I6_9ACTN|nr:VC0807 family protein [Actinomadura fibrosa]